MDGTSEWRGWGSWGGKAALAVGGMLVGGILVGTLTAGAADPSGTTGRSGAYGAPSSNGAYGGPAGPRHGGDVDESRSQRPDEHLLTGDTATKVRAARWPSTRARRCCGSRPTPTASTRPISPPVTAGASPSRSTRPSR